MMNTSQVAAEPPQRLLRRRRPHELGADFAVLLHGRIGPLRRRWRRGHGRRRRRRVLHCHDYEVVTGRDGREGALKMIRLRIETFGGDATETILPQRAGPILSCKPSN